MLLRAAAFLAGVLLALHAGAWSAVLLAAVAGAVLLLAPPRASDAPGAVAAGGHRHASAPVAALFGLGGALLCAWHVGMVQQRRLDAPRTVAAVACVTGPVRVAGNSLRFDAALAPGGEVAARRVRLSWYGAARVPAPGECWYWTLRLLPPRGLVNFHGADSERRQFAARIHARGQVRGRSARRLSAPGARSGLLRARLALAHRLRFLVGEHRHAGVPLALSVGLRDGLTPAHWRIFSATGTGHLMAISGLHVGLVGGLGFALGRCLPAGGRRRGMTRGWLGALLCAALYAALAGFTLPTVRAWIMLAAFAAAALTARRYAAADVLALALIVALAVDPLAVLGAGLWLSFGAVAALLVGRGARPGRLLAMQLSVFVGLAPLVAGWTGTLSLVSPWANLLCVPLFSVTVIPATLLASLLLPLAPAAAAALLHATLWLVTAVLAWLDALASLPLAAVTLPASPQWVLVLALCGALLILLRVRRARVLAVALCLPLLGGRPAPLAHGAWRLTVLDVGQGMAVLIETREHVVVYDSGNAWRLTDAGDVVVLPQLRALGRGRIDTLIVSHADQDHAGGAASVLAGSTVVDIYAGEPLPRVARRTLACRADVRWRYDRVTFSFVHPQEGAAWHGNDSSCVLRVQGGACSALLTGDVEALAEVSMLWHGAPLVTDVVAGQHHGSRTSSSRDFVFATAPAYVLFSTGYANRWGFPDPQVESRWRRAGAAPLDTATYGALSLTCDPQRGLGAPRAARTARPGPWRMR